jgi:hypothetical protein
MMSGSRDADTVGPYDIKGKFDQVWEKFQKTPSFWILGHSFDTMLDYLDIYCANHPESDTIRYAETAITRMNLATDEAWYDDDGWWTIAALKAYGLCDRLGWQKKKQEFLDICIAKWARFVDNAPTIWDRCKPPYEPYDLEPKHPGGVWNSGWMREGCKPDDKGNYRDQYNIIVPSFWASCTPYDDKGDKLGGFQNTVTNALYLVAAQRLYMTPDTQAPYYLTWANTEYGFLTDWFDDRDTPLLNSWAAPTPTEPLATAAVVRERVCRYENGTTPVGFDPRQAWTGDQGIVLGALADRMRIGTPAEHDACLERAKQIIGGVRTYLTDGSGVLLNWPRIDLSQTPGKPKWLPAPGESAIAYCTGVGAFMRYFTYIYRTSPELKAYCDSSGLTKFIFDMVPILDQSAAYAEQCTSAAGRITPLLNSLALMIAGYVIDRTPFDAAAAEKR